MESFVINQATCSGCGHSAGATCTCNSTKPRPYFRSEHFGAAVENARKNPAKPAPFFVQNTRNNSQPKPPAPLGLPTYDFSDEAQPPVEPTTNAQVANAQNAEPKPEPKPEPLGLPVYDFSQ